MKLKSKRPEIRLSNNPHDVSSWFSEKSTEALKHLAKAVDRAASSVEKPAHHHDLAAAIRYNASIFAVIHGFEQELDITDADLIINEGTIGLQMFEKKYGVQIS